MPAGCTRVGMGTGWVPGGAIPGTTQPPRGGPQYSEAGPGSPMGLEWVVLGAGRATGDGGGDGLLYHPAGPVGPCGPSLYRTPWNAASQPITARFDLISYKLSENGRVSPEYVDKACHSPYIQNGCQNSPLDFLRFPISPAFSHKELMVPFMT